MKATIRLNSNINTIKPSATLAINQQVKALRAQGQSVIHLGFGESPFPVPDALKEALQQYSHEKAYLPGEGLPELREAIARYYADHYDYTYGEDDVFVTPGSKEAIFHLLYLLDGPLLLPKPSWVSYKPQAKLLGKPVIEIDTRFEHQYCLQPEELIKACESLDKQQSKILILNSPNNPTGICYSQDNLDALASVCRANHILVISDEIYAGTTFRNESHSSMAYAYPEGCIVTSGLSKVFSAGGYRLGFCLLPTALKSLKAALSALISETFSCVSAPIQYAALAAYTSDKTLQTYIEQCRDLHQIAGHYLYQRFMEMHLRCAKPMGAFYLMPDFSHYRQPLANKGINSDKELCDVLLHQCSVAVLPGSDFGMDECDLSIRVASVDYDGGKALESYQDQGFSIEKSMPHLLEACHRLEQALSRLNK